MAYAHAMTKQPFLNPQLEEAFMTSFTNDVSKQFSAIRDNLVSSKNVLAYNHGHNFQNPANPHGGDSTGIKKHSTVTEISFEDIREQNAERIFLNAQEMSNQMQTLFHGELIQVVSEATEKTGNIVDGKGKTIHETLYETLEMLEPILDENGELSMPTIMVHPDDTRFQKPLKEDPEFTKRFEALKLQKKIEATEKEAQRLMKFERPEG